MSSLNHCVKSVLIRCFFLSVFSCIQSKYRKIRTIKTPYLETFHTVIQSDTITNIRQILSNWVLLSSNIAMYPYRGHSTSTLLRKGRGSRRKKRQKVTYAENSRKFFYVPFLYLNIPFLVSHEALIILQRVTIIFVLFIWFSKKYYNFTTLSIWVVYTYMCVAKCDCV